MKTLCKTGHIIWSDAEALLVSNQLKTDLKGSSIKLSTQHVLTSVSAVKAKEHTILKHNGGEVDGKVKVSRMQFYFSYTNSDLETETFAARK